MAKITRIAAKEYDSLMKALCRSKFQNSARLARVLLETWAFEDGQMNSEWWTREGVCAKGKCTILRSSLIKNEWIRYREDSNKYFPGRKLKPYLEKYEEQRTATLSDISRVNEKISNLDDKKADKIDLMAVQRDVKDIKEQLKILFKKLETCNAPPPGAEKQEDARKITDEIKLLLDLQSKEGKLDLGEIFN